MIARACAGLTALVLGVLCSLALGCGSSGSSSDLLRQAEAAGLKTELDALRQSVDDRKVGSCAADLQALLSKVDNLPNARRSIRTRLKEEITDKLGPATRKECAKPKKETIPTTTEEAPPPTTTTTETTPPPTQSTTTSEIPPPPPPPTTSVPDPGTDPGGVSPTDPGADPGGFGGPGSADPGSGTP